ncbi:MAG TPA: condensation domain-containing protein [Acidimicrobiales bacterium]|nr:condensation domain-containing protein [Acidimicrobiales bacterium]
MSRAANERPRSAPPLSVAQEALWYLSLLVPNQFSYNEAISIRKDGAFNLDAFRRAFNEIVRRHEAWRTTFDIVDGVPVQIVQSAPTFDLPVLDLSHLTEEQAERQAVRLAAQVSRVPYDLRRGPLLRPRLIRFPGEHHRLYLAMHHLVFDGVSVYRIVPPELVALYDAYIAGKPSPLAEPETQYADYARWEQNWMTEPRARRRLEHWQKQLSDLPVLSLPLDHPRPPLPRFRGGVIPLEIPAGTVAKLRAGGQEAGASLFQVLSAVWALLLGRYSGQDDVVFATATDLRQRPELESVVGYSLTPLVLRVDLSGDPSFRELVVRVRNVLLDGLDNLVPFERLVRQLPIGRTSSANPIYQTMFILEPKTLAPDPSWSIHQMESEIGDAVGSAKLDLELELDERPEGHIAGRLIYDRDLFETTSARRMVTHWLRLVGAVADDPAVTASEIPILTPAQEHRQLVEWNATVTVRPSDVVHHLIAEQATRQPKAPAVAADGERVSYGDLHRRARWMTERLRAGGVRPGTTVALCGEPSVDLVAGVLGVLQAGAAYLLLDPALPLKQLDFMMTDSAAVALVAPAELAARFPAPPDYVLEIVGRGDGPAVDEPVHESGSESDGVRGDSVCCVQYTAHSTGRPVGVPIRHDSVVNMATALAADLGIASADTVLVLPATFFRAPETELLLPLIAGAKIVLAPDEMAGDGGRLRQLIAGERVSYLHASPSAWQVLIDSGLRASRGLAALSGGEPLSRELADQILERCRVLWNAYGAVETTVYSTMARVERTGPITIGRPIANTRVYVLDGHGRPVPLGATGELLVAGDGVASGYLDRPELSELAFVDDPFGAGRAYRTGDLARWRKGGELELVPRQNRMNDGLGR